MASMPDHAAAGGTSRRLYVYNGGFLTQTRIRRILSLAGYDIKLGKPGDMVHVEITGAAPNSLTAIGISQE